MKIQIETHVCDDCLNIAYDNGIKGYEEQAKAMIELGFIVEDHLCDEIETEGEIKCDCSCKPKAKARLRK